jgi:hypothetical protein
MEPNELTYLEARYWAGATDAAEEARLRAAALAGSAHLSADLTALLTAAAHAAEVQAPPTLEAGFWQRVEQPPRGRLRALWFSALPAPLHYAAAATVLIAAAAALWLYPGQGTHTPAYTAEYDYHDTFTNPEEALEATRNALLMMSQHINEAEEKAQEIKRFHQTKLTITGSAPR